MIQKISFEKKSCFKNPGKRHCIDLFITDSTGSFKNTTTLRSGLLDFHKMILTVLKATFQKVQSKDTESLKILN